jgi:outer membrane protein assembly factor BamA
MMTRFCLVLLFAGTLMYAQTKPAARSMTGATSVSAYKLISVNVTGTRYKPADVLPAAGLKIGQEVTDENFKAATARLADTGLFTDIAYSYSYSTAGMKLDLQLADNSDLVPVRFENFVWYSDQVLIDTIHSQLALFEGKVPVSGGLLDQIANLLSGLVATHGPKLHATYLRAAPSPDSPKIDSVVFSVSGAPITIRKLNYEGATPSFTAPLAEVAKKIEGGEYLRSRLVFFSDMDARAVYLKHGYLKTQFGEPRPQVVGEGADGISVDVVLPVNEGLQYKLANIDWSGNGDLSTKQLQPLIHLGKDQPANALQLQEDLASVRKLYATRGYLRAAIDSEPEFDDANATVSYHLAVKPGPVYHLGEVEIDGLDDKAQARLREDWRLREGEPYDQSYALTFMRESARDLPPGVHWKMLAHESVNENEKTVDVTIVYTKGG